MNMSKIWANGDNADCIPKKQTIYSLMEQLKIHQMQTHTV